MLGRMRKSQEYITVCRLRNWHLDSGSSLFWQSELFIKAVMNQVQLI